LAAAHGEVEKLVGAPLALRDRIETRSLLEGRTSHYIGPSPLMISFTLGGFSMTHGRSIPMAARCTGALIVFAMSACDPARIPTVVPGVGSSAQNVVVPAKGTPTTLDFGEWNVEWFGDPANGPTNEALQQSNVRDAIAGADMDIWALEEVVDSAAFRSMKNQLTGYAGFVANEPIVVNGPQFYSDFSNTEQKVAILYKSSLATLLGAKVILTGNDFDFAGRPPMEVKLHVTLNGSTEDIVVIVLHMKCCSDDDSWQRRVNASNALKSYLDATYPTQKVFVIGDWNDDVDTSIDPGHASPYQNFVTDAARYTFETKTLSDLGIASTTGFPDMIDHHLVTNEGHATYVAGSAEVYRLDQYIANYSTTTSDHYPVLSRYTFGGGGGGNQPPTASFTSSCSGLTCTFTDGSSDTDGTIASWSWTLGDGGTSTVQNPSHTYAASGTYAVGLTVTDNGGATSSTSQSVTVTAPSGITLSTRGYKVRGVPKVDLTWSGATGSNVDVYRNGALIISTANDGTHTDTLAKGSQGTFTYKVCNAGTSTCSNVSSVTF
jgi:PKD repeat protein